MRVSTSAFGMMLVSASLVQPAGRPPEAEEWPKLAHVLEGWSYGLAFSPDGKTLAAGGRDGGIRPERVVVVWNVTTGKPVTTLGGLRNVMAVAYHPNGKVIAGGGEGIALWNPATDKAVVGKAKAHRGLVRTLAFSTDGKLLASGSSWDSKLGKTVGLWRSTTLKSADPLPVYTGNVSAVAFCPDGKLLAFGGMGGEIRLWDLDAGRDRVVIAPVGRPHFRSLAFSPDGKILVSAQQHRGPKKNGSATSPGDTVVDERHVTLWDTTTGKLVDTLAGHGEAVLSVAYSPDGRILASASSDRTVRLWELKSKKTLAKLEVQSPKFRPLKPWVDVVAFSPDGKLLATASRSGDVINLWSLDRKK